MLADAATVNARVAAALAEFRRHDAVHSCAAILHCQWMGASKEEMATNTMTVDGKC